MYMFGGEFTSPSLAKFSHYGDTWRFKVLFTLNFLTIHPSLFYYSLPICFQVPFPHFA